MKRLKTVELDLSRMYGFRILDDNARSVLASKVGVKKPVQQVLGSKIGGGKLGFKKV